MAAQTVPEICILIIMATQTLQQLTQQQAEHLSPPQQYQTQTQPGLSG